jgi:hypothetical protein
LTSLGSPKGGHGGGRKRVVVTADGVSKRYGTIKEASQDTGLTWWEIKKGLVEKKPHSGFSIRLASKEER